MAAGDILIIADGCQANVTHLPSHSGNPSLTLSIPWPEINIGETAIVRCPCGNVSFGAGSLEATRYCGGSFTTGAKWDREMSAACDFSDRARKICNLATVSVSCTLQLSQDELSLLSLSLPLSLSLSLSQLEVGARVSALEEVTKSSREFDAADVSVAAAVLVDATEAVEGNKTVGIFLTYRT